MQASKKEAEEIVDHWWYDKHEVSATWHMLRRAGIAVDAREFREKPYKWTQERNRCRELERFMADNGVTAADGWDMTASDIVQAGMR